jgi:hypothetical protein
LARARESELRANAIEFPLVHPQQIERNIDADNFTFQDGFGIDLSGRKGKAA